MQLVTPSGERHQAHVTCDHWASPYRPVLAYRDATGRLHALEREPRPGWSLVNVTADEAGELVQLGFFGWVVTSTGRNVWSRRVTS